MDDLDKAIKALNEQKGNVMALSCLLMGVLRALPYWQRVNALREFDTEAELARTVLLNSKVHDDVLNGFDQQLASLNHTRLQKPAP